MYRLNKKKIALYIGKILMVLSIIFIAHKLYQYNLDLDRLADWKIWIGIVLLVMLHGANIFIFATSCYTIAVNLYSQKKISLPKVMRVYCKSSLYKYIPSNIMHFVGRNQLAIDENVPHSDIILATITEIACLIMAAVIITLLCGINQFKLYAQTMGADPFKKALPVICICIISFLAAAALLISFRHKLRGYISRYQAAFTCGGAKKIVKILMLCVVRLTINAVIFMLCLNLLSHGLPANMYMQVVSLFIVSWVIGFLMPGAPGGLGIREAVMCFFLSGIIGQENILYATLVYRVICILGDIISYFYSLLLPGLFFKRQG